MEDKSKSHEITSFVPGIQDVAGWSELGRKRQDDFLERVSRLQEHRKFKAIGELTEMADIHMIQKDFGDSLDLREAFQRIYTDEEDRRKVFRRVALHQELIEALPDGFLEQLHSLSMDMLDKFKDLRRFALGDIKNAAKQLPATTVKTAAQAVTFAEAVIAKAKANKRANRGGEPIPTSKEEAQKMTANSLIYYCKAAGLKTSEQKIRWVTPAISWFMEHEAIPGRISAKRATLPEGVPPKRGRPAKEKPEEK